MPHQRRGPKEWMPGMTPGAVPGRRKGQDFRLKFVRRITSMDEVPENSDFELNVELALPLGHAVEHYRFEEWRGGRLYRKDVGDMLWWPKFRRAGVVFWPEAQTAAEWTDADNPLDALSRWVANEMTGD